jgi:hypothetical protein
MLTQFRWCISVALCLDAQPVGSTTDPMLRSLARRVPLAGSEPKRQLGKILRGPASQGLSANSLRLLTKVTVLFIPSCFVLAWGRIRSAEPNDWRKIPIALNDLAGRNVLTPGFDSQIVEQAGLVQYCCMWRRMLDHRRIPKLCRRLHRADSERPARSNGKSSGTGKGCRNIATFRRLRNRVR